MRSFSRKPVWIAIACMTALCCIVAVQGCTPVLPPQAPATRTITGGSAGNLQLQGFTKSAETCTREAMDRCESGCMMPGGILDLSCYEDCIYSIC